MLNLDTQVFEGEADKNALEHLLETLDNITPKFISRIDYEQKKGKVLKKTRKGKEGVFYDLYLPHDLKVGEQVYIINMLMNKFNLSNSELDNFISYTKILIGTLLRGGKSEADFKEIIEKYNIPKIFIDKLKPVKEGGQKMNINEHTKNFVKSIKLKRSKNSKGEKDLTNLGKNVGDKEIGESIYSQELNNELDLTFFRKAINDIRYGLEIMIKAEQDAIVIYCEENGFEKKEINGIVTYSRYIYFEGTSEIIEIRNKNNTEEDVKKLRDKIGIDKLKLELEELRKEGDKKKIAQKEFEIANKIAKEIYNSFPYYLNLERNGYKIKEILKTKQIFCIGFSIVGHTFLKELGIIHKGLELMQHSALEINIGGKSYCMDLAQNGTLEELVDSGKKSGAYSLGKFGNKEYEKFFISGDPEKILISQVYNNKGNHISDPDIFERRQGIDKEVLLKRKEVAVKMYDKAIQYNSYYADAYINKGKVLFSLGYKNQALEMIDKALTLNPGIRAFYYQKATMLSEMGYGKIAELYFFVSGETKKNNGNIPIESLKINQLISNHDINGLRLFLLELEHQEISR